MANELIPFITLPNWVKAAAQCGFNVEPIFRELGVETDLVHLEEARISPDIIDRAMEMCVAQSKTLHFPFVLGETFAFDYLPELETFVTTAGTLREAARVFTWVRELVNPLMDVRVEEQSDTASLVLMDPPDYEPLKSYYSESIFAATLKFGRALLGEQPGFMHICFRHRRPSPRIDYENFFRMPVLFGQTRNEVIMPRSLLDAPLTGGFPSLHRQAEFRIEQKFSQPAFKGTVSTAILESLATQPGLLGSGIDRTAVALGMHSRTLQRRLQEEGTSFFELQDRARHQAAVEALQQGETDLERLSERLGFSDRRSFTRAFKRWSGLSPSSFRQHQKPPQKSPD